MEGQACEHGITVTDKKRSLKKVRLARGKGGNKARPIGIAMLRKGQSDDRKIRDRNDGET